MKDKSLYAQAGVDIDKANELVKRIRPMVASTFKRGVLTEIGGFAGLFALDLDRYHEPVLVSSTDGVGTKIKIATLCNMHETIGIDLVAMCVNDILV
ncbi:MAG TPA: phosphoribosylformylglycinamidine cyclo-ligase, partial [Deltaproteobacteria bacterium]|nr:phosphoribosylformylglycinamidine cyclo-ligase [Deltaproteobacteria bacterium]